MDVTLDPSLARGYKSKSQIARVVTEEWGQRNLYCAACDSATLRPFQANKRARDFECPTCATTYQLKARRRRGNSVADAGYSAMIEAIRSDRVPALYVLTYLPTWRVQDLVLVHPAFFSESCIDKRAPLSERARRARHVLCNILLNRIAPAGVVPVIDGGTPLPPKVVRERFREAQSLRTIATQERGWTLDVLRVVQGLPESFSLADVYAFEDELRQLHPRNKHVKDKIRQQLQVLRDLGYIEFLDRGKYRWIK